MRTMSSVEHGERESLNLRIKPDDRNLIDRAAKISGKNRTSFVLDAARAAAHEALEDQTDFAVSADAYARFLAKLDEPPAPNELLRKTMTAGAPWARK